MTHYNHGASLFRLSHFITDFTLRTLLRTPRFWMMMMILASCALVASTYHYFRHTWDEPEHLAAGMQLIDKSVYTYDQQHPPLARVAMAIGPYLAGAHSFGEPGPSGEQEGRDLLYRTGNYELLLSLARLGMLPFFVVLLWSTWAWAKHVYGTTTGLLAVALLIATPPILGHAGVAALDIPGAATCTLAFYCLLRWFERHSWRNALAAGLTSGLAIATKLSGLPFIAVVGAAWLLAAWVWRGAAKDAVNVPARTILSPRWYAQVLSVLVVAFICAIFSYGFKFHYLVTDAAPVNTAFNYLFGKQGMAHDMAYAVARHVPLPRGVERLPWSIEALAQHNADGHLSYLLGHFSNTGFRYFYVVAMAVRTPLALLLFGIGGLIFLCRRHELAPRSGTWIYAAPTLAFVVLLAFCSFYSHINIGLRHVFVLYPLLSIAAAVWTVSLWRRYRHFAPRAVIVVLLAWQGSSLVTAYPDYLSYFNFTAGKHPEHILIDSDLDWGQDLKRLRKRLLELNITHFGFVYRGTADVIGEQLKGVWIAQPFNPATGWIAASIYARDTVAEGRAFAWLKQYTPRERIGKSIDLYYIPPDIPPGAAPAP